jgi:hypothetical protein
LAVRKQSLANAAYPSMSRLFAAVIHPAADSSSVCVLRLNRCAGQSTCEMMRRAIDDGEQARRPDHSVDLSRRGFISLWMYLSVLWI